MRQANVIHRRIIDQNSRLSRLRAQRNGRRAAFVINNFRIAVGRFGIILIVVRAGACEVLQSGTATLRRHAVMKLRAGGGVRVHPLVRDAFEVQIAATGRRGVAALVHVAGLLIFARLHGRLDPLSGDLSTKNQFRTALAHQARTCAIEFGARS